MGEGEDATDGHIKKSYSLTQLKSLDKKAISPLNLVVSTGSHHHTVSEGEEAVLRAFLGEESIWGECGGAGVGIGVQEEGLWYPGRGPLEFLNQLKQIMPVFSTRPRRAIGGDRSRDHEFPAISSESWV